MMYFVILFVPPLYFAIRKKWGACIVNGFFYLCSFPLLFFFGFGVLIWALCIGHAGWHLRRELMDEQAQMIATRMVEKIGTPNLQAASASSHKIEEPILAVNVESRQPNLTQPSGGFCPNCGGKNPTTSSFCGNCGSRLS